MQDLETRKIFLTIPLADARIEVKLEPVEERRSHHSKYPRKYKNNTGYTHPGGICREKNSMKNQNETRRYPDGAGVKVPGSQRSKLPLLAMPLRIQGLDGRYTQILKMVSRFMQGSAVAWAYCKHHRLTWNSLRSSKALFLLYGGGAIAGLVNLI